MPCSCSNSRCGCDFSSRIKRKPDLTSIEVVSDLFFQASRKTAARLNALHEGLLSPEEFRGAQERLADWIGTTFSGANTHYGSSEGWNPKGLAAYARHVCAEQIRQAVGFLPTDDAETIFALALMYRRDLETSLETYVRCGTSPLSFALSDLSVQLINRWSRLMTGAPVEFVVPR